MAQGIVFSVLSILFILFLIACSFKDSAEYVVDADDESLRSCVTCGQQQFLIAAGPMSDEPEGWIPIGTRHDLSCMCHKDTVS